MSAFVHSPGPWRPDRVDLRSLKRGGDVIVRSGLGLEIGCVYMLCHRDGGMEATSANLNLMCAAPMLLDQLVLTHRAIDVLFARLAIATSRGNGPQFFPSESGMPWQACVGAHALIEKLRAPESPEKTAAAIETKASGLRVDPAWVKGAR